MLKFYPFLFIILFPFTVFEQLLSVEIPSKYLLSTIDLSIDQNGNYYATISRTVDTLSKNKSVYHGRAISLFKLDGIGNIEWKYESGYSFIEDFSDILVSKDGTIFLLSQAKDFSEKTPYTKNYLSKISNEGKLIHNIEIKKAIDEKMIWANEKIIIPFFQSELPDTLNEEYRKIQYNQNLCVLNQHLEIVAQLACNKNIDSYIPFSYGYESGSSLHSIYLSAEKPLKNNEYGEVLFNYSNLQMDSLDYFSTILNTGIISTISTKYSDLFIDNGNIISFLMTYQVYDNSKQEDMSWIINNSAFKEFYEKHNFLPEIFNSRTVLEFCTINKKGEKLNSRIVENDFNEGYYSKLIYDNESNYYIIAVFKDFIKVHCINSDMTQVLNRIEVDLDFGICDVIYNEKHKSLVFAGIRYDKVNSTNALVIKEIRTEK